MDISLKPIVSRLGGKTKLTPTILKYISKVNYNTYCEPFVGGGSIYFAKQLSEYNIINDLDKNLIDIYKQIAELEKFDIEYTKNECCKENFIKIQEKIEPTLADKLLMNKLSFGKSFYSPFKTKEGIPKLVNLKKHFINYKYKLENTLILNEPAKKTISEYDSKTTLFYLDPPYSKPTKNWNYIDNPTRDDILAIIMEIKGKFILSYDYTENNKEIFENAGFNVDIVNTKYSSVKNPIQELIVYNFNI